MVSLANGNGEPGPRPYVMIFKDLFRDVVATLWSQKRRTFLTMFGIAWGVVSIVLMVAAGEGLRVGQKKVGESFARDLMIVFAGRTSLQAGGTRAGRCIFFETSDIPTLQADSPSCRYIMPELGQSDLKVHSSYNSGLPIVTGAYPDFPPIRSIPVDQRRSYN